MHVIKILKYQNNFNHLTVLNKITKKKMIITKIINKLRIIFLLNKLNKNLKAFEPINLCLLKIKKKLAMLMIILLVIARLL